MKWQQFVLQAIDQNRAVVLWMKVCLCFSVTETLIEPMKAHLMEIEAHIEDQLDLIAAVKSNILKNDDRIEKMLGSVTKH